MTVDPEDMIVTTGGQQVIDLVTKTLIDPGDVVDRRGPRPTRARCPSSTRTRPTWSTWTWTATGCGSTCSRTHSTSLSATTRRPKFIYTVPTFQNPGGVTTPLPRRRRLARGCRRARAARARGQPVRSAPLRGRPVAAAVLARRGRRHRLCTSARPRRSSRQGIRLGWVVAPPPVLEKINLGKQAADLCSSTLSQLMVQAYFELGRWREYVQSLTEIYRSRRDTMLDVLARHPPPQAEWTQPGRRPLHLGDPARLHRHHRPPRPRAARKRRLRSGRGRLPARPRPDRDAPELLRPRRGRHPRGHPPAGRGHPRAGRAVRHAHGRPGAHAAAAATEAGGADILQLPARPRC